MNSLSRVWQPATGPGLSLPQQQALSVPDPKGPMGRSLYLSLLEGKLTALVAADPQEARGAMEMSQEAAPDLWAIAEQSPPSRWASELVRSDGVNALLSAVADFKKATGQQCVLCEQEPA